MGGGAHTQKPHPTHLVGQQEALDGSADGFQVGFSPNFKSVFGGRQELGAHLLHQEAVLGGVQGAEAGHLVASHLDSGGRVSPLPTQVLPQGPLCGSTSKAITTGTGGRGPSRPGACPSPSPSPGTHGVQHEHRRPALGGHKQAEERLVALRVVVQVEVADAPCRATRPSPRRAWEAGPGRAKAAGTRPTWFQVAELGQRAHLQVLESKGFCFSARKVSHQLFIDHTHTAQLHEGPEQ